MNTKEFFGGIKDWFSNHSVELFISLLILILYFISRSIILRLITRHAKKHSLDESRMLYVKKITGLINLVVFMALFGLTWQISLSGLSFYFASIFTVVGVALFANWSILSNITASVLLFFFFPHKIGATIRIEDAENSVEGLIMDLTMFYIEIKKETGEIVSYPNNLAIQKPSVVVHPKS